jgi:hypothetical protein
MESYLILHGDRLVANGLSHHIMPSNSITVSGKGKKNAARRLKN